MNQNSVIFGALFIGFLVYITIRGELPKYAAIFTTSKKKSPSSTTQNQPVINGQPKTTGPWNIDPDGYPSFTPNWLRLFPQQTVPTK